MNLGATIKKYRKRKRISQQVLANKCNLSQGYLSQIENNQKDPTVSVLNIVSECLNIPLPFLFVMSLEKKDIKSDKRRYFYVIQSSVNSFIDELIR